MPRPSTLPVYSINSPSAVRCPQMNTHVFPVLNQTAVGDNQAVRSNHEAAECEGEYLLLASEGIQECVGNAYLRQGRLDAPHQFRFGEWRKRLARSGRASGRAGSAADVDGQINP